MDKPVKIASGNPKQSINCKNNLGPETAMCFVVSLTSLLKKAALEQGSDKGDGGQLSRGGTFGEKKNSKRSFTNEPGLRFGFAWFYF